MANTSLTPNFQTRDLILARLLELRPELEAEGVRHAFLFGSVARGDDVPESDVDIILDLDPERHVGIFEFAGIRRFLREELGRDVDLGTRRSLLPGRHDRIIAELVEAF
jgi:predicted nucleotidyltransferase